MQRAAKNKTIWLVLLALASVLPSPVIALSGLDQGVQNRVELFLRGAQNGTGRHPFEPAKRVENYDRRPGTASESPVAPNRGLASTGDGVAMDSARYSRMRNAFERGGRRFIDDSPDAQMQLFEAGGRSQTGLTLSADDVLMVPNPSASTFFDEMIHTVQFRNGRVARANQLYGDDLAIDVLEFEVQRKLLRNASSYGITSIERASIRNRALGIYQRIMNNPGRSGQSVRDMINAIQ